MKNFKRILVVTLLLLTLVATALLTTGCGGSSRVGEIDVSTIAYNGEKISWGYAENASKYILNVNGTEYPGIFDTQIAYRTDSEAVTVEITPVSAKGKEGEKVTKTFTKLPTIEELYFDENGTLSWDAVAGASAYIVKVNGKESEKITSCSYSNFELGKTNKISVRATSTDNSTYSYFSDEVMKTYLAPPTNVKYDGDKITWSGSSQASGYEVIINGVPAETVTNSSYYMYNAAKTTFDLSMKALGDGESVFSSPESTSHKYVYLADVDMANLQVENGNLKWDEVADATAYQIKINMTEKTVKTPEYKNLTTGVDNIIKIKPTATSNDKNVTYFSTWSEEVTIHILAAPLASWNGNYNLDGDEMNAFEWKSVIGEVSGYEVLLEYPNGTSESFPVSKDRNNFGYAFADTGDYKISVKAVADEGSGIYESAYSTPILVRRLAPPSAASGNFITSNTQDITKGFTVALKDQGQNVKYSIFKEGVPIITGSTKSTITVTDIVNSNVTTRQELTYEAQAIGLGKEELQNGQKIVVLSSLSAENLEIKITVLETPSLAETPISGKTLSWTNITGARGYHVAGFGTGSTETTNSCSLAQIKTAGDYKLKVCALGDGGAVLPSFYSEEIRVRKLAAPTNVRVRTTGESEGSIDFDDVKGATSYSFFFNGSEEPISQDAMNNVNDYVTVTGVQIRVMANADAYFEGDQIYCLASEKSDPALNLAVLKGPGIPTVPQDGKNLIWTSPNNASGFTPEYRVFTGSGQLYDGKYNSTFSLESFEPGTYTFYIQAIGDGINWLNSEKVGPITITKLATPEVEINTGSTSYRWSFVKNAQKYLVKVNGIIVDDDIEAASGHDYFEYKLSPEVFSKPGSYKVEIIATSQDSHTINSTPWTYEQWVKQVATPTFEMTYSADSYTNGAPIIITAQAADTNTTGFVFIVAGTASEAQESNVFEYVPQATATISAKVVATGGKFDDNKIYYINSADSTTKTITILGSMNVDDIVPLSRYRIGFEKIKDAKMYELELVDLSTDEIIIKMTVPEVQGTDHEFDLSEYSNNGLIQKGVQYKIRIRATGNNNPSLISSAWTETYIMFG